MQNKMKVTTNRYKTTKRHKLRGRVGWHAKWLQTGWKQQKGNTKWPQRDAKLPQRGSMTRERPEITTNRLIRSKMTPKRHKMKTFRGLMTTSRGGPTLETWQKMSNDYDKEISNSEILQKVAKSHKMTIEINKERRKVATMKHDYREKQHRFKDIQNDHKETQSDCIQRSNDYVLRRNNLRELLYSREKRKQPQRTCWVLSVWESCSSVWAD